MEKKVNGIVVRTVNYGESDKILTLYTLEGGLVSVRAKGVKKSGAKLKACTEPFCFAEYVLACSGDRNVLTGASIHDGFYALREDIVKFYAGNVVLDFLRIFGTEEPEPELFDLAVNAIKNVAYGEGEPYVEVAVFLYESLKTAGYGMEVGECSSCGGGLTDMAFFNVRSGEFVCKNCAKDGDIRVSLVTYSALKNIESGLDPCETFKDYGVEEKRAAEVKVLKFLRYYLQNKIGEDLKSLKELIEL